MDDRDIKVLVVEDSRSTAMALTRLLSTFNIVGVAATGEDALRLFTRLKPDVVTMDIVLPDMNGIELTRQLLVRRHVPIVIISALVEPARQQLIFDALRAGAFDVVPKSRFLTEKGSSDAGQRFVRLLRTAASRRKPTGMAHPAVSEGKKNYGKRDILTIGASTGGTAALSTIYSGLTPDFPLPILVAQHMSKGFTEAFVTWLDSHVPITVRIGKEGEIPAPGIAYLPPSGYHLSLVRPGSIHLVPATDEGPCPSVDMLFEAVAEVYGSRGIYLLLTGMGADGASGLLTAKRQRGLTAIQDEETSTIFGMPQAALQAGAAEIILPLPQISAWLAAQATIGRF
jgi:two-component system chemotaxis response regulator CheB